MGLQPVGPLAQHRYQNGMQFAFKSADRSRGQQGPWGAPENGWKFFELQGNLPEVQLGATLTRFCAKNLVSGCFWHFLGMQGAD